MILKMKYPQIVEVRAAMVAMSETLASLPLDERPSTLTYALTKTLKKLNKQVDELVDLVKDIRDKHIDKTENGEPKTYREMIPDGRGGKQEGQVTKISDAAHKKAYEDEYKQFVKDEHDVEIHQVSLDAVGGQEGLTKFNANHLSVLLDVFLVEGEADAKKTAKEEKK